MSKTAQLAVQLAVEHLYPKEPMEETKDFKPARLVRSKEGEYVLFYAFDKQKGKVVRKRKFLPASLTTKEARTAYAKDLIKKLNLILEDGFYIDRTKTKKIKEAKKRLEVDSKLTLDEIIPKYLKYAQNILKISEKELESKMYNLRGFLRWCKLKSHHIEYLDDITYKMAQEYFDYLVEERTLASKTYNNKLGQLKSFYNTALKRKWVEKQNPFDFVERQSSDYGEKNIPFSQSQLNEIVPYLKQKDPYIWQFICFIYYAFMRPSEIKRLKVENIDMDKKLIKINSRQSKVKKLDFLPIAAPLYEILISMELHKENPNHYLFTAEEKPGETPMSSSYTTKHFKVIKDYFGLSSNHSIYAFKHTAVCRWYEQEKDIVRIQKMCRHTTIEMTARYLKSLGLLTDVYKIETLPPIIII